MEPRLEPPASYWGEEKEIVEDDWEEYQGPSTSDIDKALTAWENRHDK